MTNNNNVVNANSGTVRKIVITVIVLFIAVILVFNSFTTVKAGHTGVVTTFGKVSDGVLAEGLHFKIPGEKTEGLHQSEKRRTAAYNRHSGAPLRRNGLQSPAEEGFSAHLDGELAAAEAPGRARRHDNTADFHTLTPF